MRATTVKKTPVINLSKDISTGTVHKGLIAGLTAENKTIEPKFFYDEGGAWLFQQITRLPEYYLSRLEKNILKSYSHEILREMPGNNIVELASGDCSKIAILLNSSMGVGKKRISYFPYEINAGTIREAVNWLMKMFPYIDVQGVVADITSQFYAIPQIPNRLICFFGSTIGNFSPEDTLFLMKNLAGLMHPGEQLLIGMDMVKEKRIMELAYNDSQGITAAFNKNVLYVVNHLLETDFDPDDFDHVAFFNEKMSRIEMHLVAKERVEVKSQFLKEPLILHKGESIHTENSRKFLPSDIDEMASVAGLKVDRIFSDADGWYSVVRFVAV